MWSIRPDLGKNPKEFQLCLFLTSLLTLRKYQNHFTIVVFVQTLEGELQLLLMLLQVLAELAEVEPFVFIFITR